MTSRTVRTEYERDRFLRYVRELSLPFVADITKGVKRSNEQNKLNRLWCKEIAEQLGDTTSEEIRGYCKLAFGVPILREENEAFRERYDAIVKPLPYEQKLALMMEPFDFGVTRLMNTAQQTEYLERMRRHWNDKGMALTDPDPMVGLPAHEMESA